MKPMRIAKQLGLSPAEAHYLEGDEKVQRAREEVEVMLRELEDIAARHESGLYGGHWRHRSDAKALRAIRARVLTYIREGR